MSGGASDVFKTTIRQNLGPIVPFLDDPTVSEILINGPHEIFIERRSCCASRNFKKRIIFSDLDRDLRFIRGLLNGLVQTIARQRNEIRFSTTFNDGHFSFLVYCLFNSGFMGRTFKVN